jgi:hypothetical protein
VDILVPEDLANHTRIIAALSELQDHAATELIPQDFVDNVVVKSRRRSGSQCQHTRLEGHLCRRPWPIVENHHLGCGNTVSGFETLIASKRTQRGQDQVDVQRLLSLDR